jgi:hypothetical protein
VENYCYLNNLGADLAPVSLILSGLVNRLSRSHLSRSDQGHKNCMVVAPFTRRILNRKRVDTHTNICCTSSPKHAY